MVLLVQECWWDTLVLDMLVCNMLGALVGQWIMVKIGTSLHDIAPQVAWTDMLMSLPLSGRRTTRSWYRDASIGRLSMHYIIIVERSAMVLALFGLVLSLSISHPSLLLLCRCSRFRIFFFFFSIFVQYPI